MTDIAPLLRKGALVAQNPPEFESVEELEPAERDALRNEVLHKWRQPKALYLTVILCSVGAAVQYVMRPLCMGLSSNVLQEGGIRLVPTVQTCLSLSSSTSTPSLVSQTTIVITGLSVWSIQHLTLHRHSCALSYSSSPLSIIS